MIGQFTSKLDQVAIGSFLGQSSLGLYNVSSNVARRPVDLIRPVLGSVMFPVYARLRSNSGQIQKAYDDSVQLLAIVMLSIAFCVSLMAPEIVNILLGSKWNAAIPILTVIPFYFSLILMETPSRQMAQAAGFSGRLLFWNLLSGVLIFSLIVAGVYLTSGLRVIAVLLVLSRLVLYALSFVFLVRSSGVLWWLSLRSTVLRVVLPFALCLGLWHLVLQSDGLYQRIAFAIGGVILCVALNGRRIVDLFQRLIK
jgi:O-antigen/teichoic acid export membrane protein